MTSDYLVVSTARLLLFAMMDLAIYSTKLDTC